MNPYLAVGSIIFSIALTALGNGMMGTFVPIRLNAEGYGQTTTAVVITAYAAGMLIGCLLAGWALRRAGHIRAFAAFAAIATISALLLVASQQAWVWVLLRVLGGFCTTAMFIAAQSWLNEITDSSHRGRVMAFFYVSFTVSLGLGALVMSRLDTAGPDALMVMAGVYAAAVVPVAFTKVAMPSPPERIAVSLIEVYRVSPVGLVGAFMAGLIAMTMQGVGALYGTLLGLAPAAIAILMAALQGGNLVIQWPLGWLSDRLDRRHVILGAALSVFALSLVLSFLGPEAAVAMVILFALWGGSAESLYSLSAAHANDHASPGDFVTVSSTLMVVWASGATLGPVIASGAMQAVGPQGLWYLFALLSAGFAGFVIWRLGQRPAPSEEMQEVFVAQATAGPFITEWNPNHPQWQDEDAEANGAEADGAEGKAFAGPGESEPRP